MRHNVKTCSHIFGVTGWLVFFFYKFKSISKAVIGTAWEDKYKNRNWNELLEQFTNSEENNNFVTNIRNSHQLNNIKIKSSFDALMLYIR